MRDDLIHINTRIWTMAHFFRSFFAAAHGHTLPLSLHIFRSFASLFGHVHVLSPPSF